MAIAAELETLKEAHAKCEDSLHSTKNEAEMLKRELAISTKDAERVKGTVDGALRDAEQAKSALCDAEVNQRSLQRELESATRESAATQHSRLEEKERVASDMDAENRELHKALEKSKLENGMNDSITEQKMAASEAKLKILEASVGSLQEEVEYHKTDVRELREARKVLSGQVTDVERERGSLWLWLNLFTF